MTPIDTNLSGIATARVSFKNNTTSIHYIENSTLRRFDGFRDLPKRLALLARIAASASGSALINTIKRCRTGPFLALRREVDAPNQADCIHKQEAHLGCDCSKIDELRGGPQEEACFVLDEGSIENEERESENDVQDIVPRPV